MLSVTTTNTTPSGSITTASPSDDGTATALATCGDDPEAAVAILSVDAGVQSQTADRSDRENDELAQERANDDAVASMRHKASLLGAQAWVDFGCSIGQSCIQAQSAASGPASPGASSSAGTQVAMVQAFDKLCDGLLTTAGASADADAKAAQNAATAAGFGVTSDGEALTSASTLVQSAMSAYQQYVSTQAQTQAAAIHRA
jgi:hypothetical protein